MRSRCQDGPFLSREQNGNYKRVQEQRTTGENDRRGGEGGDMKTASACLLFRSVMPDFLSTDVQALFTFGSPGNVESFEFGQRRLEIVHTFHGKDLIVFLANHQENLRKKERKKERKKKGENRTYVERERDWFFLRGKEAGGGDALPKLPFPRT